jgi:uncharacterized protein (TIGR02246 family)
MKHRLGTATLLTAAAVILVTGAYVRIEAQHDAGGSAAARQAIDAANKKFISAIARGDASAVAALYTVEGAAYPANSEVVQGRPALEAMWKGVIDSGITGVELTTTEHESAGDLAYEVGNYVMKMKDGTVADRGKYLVVWKRRNGQWLLHRDIWTTSLPAVK